jgi:anti-sigma factor RsiW
MRANHLSDDRLIELCMLDALSRDEQQHLSTCARCDARRIRMQRLLDDVSETATAAADAAFPLERLNRQQARILARLQHEGRPARVIAFPAGHSPHEPVASRTRPASRWIAAAAVGGLVVGVIAGRFGHDYSFPRAGAARIISAHTIEQPELRAPVTTAAIREVAASLSDDEFLDQLETAIDAPTAAALQPLDDLTPLAWEVR